MCFAGGFPAEEPDPDAKHDIPTDFLVRPCCRLRSAAAAKESHGLLQKNLMVNQMFAGVEGQPCSAAGLWTNPKPKNLSTPLSFIIICHLGHPGSIAATFSADGL